jgi:folate-binding protein YgfZ
MTPLPLHEFHAALGASFLDVNGAEAVADYGDWRAEHAALTQAAAVLDQSFRGRVVLLGADRARLLHGQCTNDILGLTPGRGGYALFASPKGRIEADAHIYHLGEELLLDLEPGLSGPVMARLEKFILAQDVQPVDAAPHYGLLSVQGPRGAEAVRALGLGLEVPAADHAVQTVEDATLGRLYVMHHARAGAAGADVFVPQAALGAVADKLIAAARALGGGPAGWTAMEAARIEAGVPRFGADFDAANLSAEAGLDARAVSFTKGCYSGQEVINRLRTFGNVAKALRGLRLPAGGALPRRGDKLFRAGREAGYVTSAVDSPRCGPIALGYVRREGNVPGTRLALAADGPAAVEVAVLPFA